MVSLADVTYNETVGYVYLLNIEGTDYYKIGVANNIAKRISDYSTHSPFTYNISSLVIVEDKYDHIRRFLERKILLKFRDKKVKGEWVKCSNDFSNDFKEEVSYLSKLYKIEDGITVL